LEKALKIQLSDEDRGILEEFMLSFPIDESEHGD
jgi:hypothetical protein